MGGRESRLCETVAGYVRAMSAPVRLGPNCSGCLDVLHTRPACGVLFGEVIADF